MQTPIRHHQNVGLQLAYLYILLNTHEQLKTLDMLRVIYTYIYIYTYYIYIHIIYIYTYYILNATSLPGGRQPFSHLPSETPPGNRLSPQLSLLERPILTKFMWERRRYLGYILRERIVPEIYSLYTTCLFLVIRSLQDIIFSSPFFASSEGRRMAHEQRQFLPKMHQPISSPLSKLLFLQYWCNLHFPISSYQNIYRYIWLFVEAPYP